MSGAVWGPLLSRRRFLLGSLAAAAAVPAGWYGLAYETDDVEVVRHVLTLRNLPARLHGMTAVQISDLHLGHIAAVHTRMLAAVQRLQPDVVFVTGDLVDDEEVVGEALDLLRNLKPPRGVWAVPGNWDHAADAVAPLMRELEAANMRLLVNGSAPLDEGLWLVGVDDPASDHEDLRRAADGVPPGAVRILLAHAPDIVRRIRSNPFDLILVGHTHGGQINLPLLNGAWLHARASRRYIEGFYQVLGSRLYVNRGIGTTTLPVRLFARPEVTHFTFQAS
jgi:predicted MPP superfamily phosphohydrolase